MTEQQPKPVLSYEAPDALRRVHWRGAVTLVLLVALVATVCVLLYRRNQRYVKVDLSVFLTSLDSGKIAELTIRPNMVYGKFATPLVTPRGVRFNYFRTDLPVGPGDNEQFIDIVKANSGTAVVTFERDSNLLMYIIVASLGLSVFLALLMWQLRRSGQVARKSNPLAPVSTPGVVVQ